MKKDVLLYVLFFLLSWAIPRTSSGQIQSQRSYGDMTLGVDGIVTDSTGKMRVPFAHVFFVRGKDTAVVVADVNGRFRYRGLLADMMRVRVTAVGFKSFEGMYRPKVDGLSILIKMRQEAMVLNEIIVTGKRLVMVVKGDTLQYNTDVIATLDGDLMKVLLEKLPGVSFENGLRVNGQPISRIYVNGSDSLFQGTEALSQIKADNVKDIKVYDERNREDQALGLKYGERETVMNVTTKRKVTRSMTPRNTLVIGGGWDASRGSFMRDKEKYTLKLLYNPFPMENFKLEGAYINASPGNDERTFSRNLYYSKGDVKDKFKFSTTNRFQGSTRYTDKWEERDYFPTEWYGARRYESANSEKDTKYDYSTTNSFSRKGRVALSVGLIYGGKGHKRRLSNRAFTLTNGERVASADAVDYNREHTSWGGGNLSLGLGRFTLKTALKLEDGRGSGWRVDTLDESTTRVDLDKDLDRRKMLWKNEISYRGALSKLWKLSGSYRYNCSEESETGTSTNLLTGLLDTNNTKDYTYYDQLHELQMDFNYFSKKTSFRLTGLLQYTMQNHVERFPYRKQYKEHYLKGGISFSTETKYSPTLNWRAYSHVNILTPGSSTTRAVIDDTDPLYLQAGNPDLKPIEMYTLIATLNKLFVSQSSHLVANLSYVLTRNIIAWDSRYFPEDTYLPEYDYRVPAGATLRTAVQADAEHKLETEVSYSKLSGLLKSHLKLLLGYDYLNRPSFMQGEQVDFIQNTGKMAVELRTNFSRKVEFTLNSSTRLSQEKNTFGEKSEFLEEKVNLSMRTTVLPRFRLNARYDYAYRKDLDSGEDTGTPNLEASISRNLGKYSTLMLNGYNLLDRQTGVSFGTTADYFFRTGQTRIGRFVMLTLQHKFK